jgi:hypothetical protein
MLKELQLIDDIVISGIRRGWTGMMDKQSSRLAKSRDSLHKSELSGGRPKAI